MRTGTTVSSMMSGGCVYLDWPSAVSPQLEIELDLGMDGGEQPRKQQRRRGQEAAAFPSPSSLFHGYGHGWLDGSQPLVDIQVGWQSSLERIERKIRIWEDLLIGEIVKEIDREGNKLDDV